jgi:divalent metal cation (Fe/Co/Zn/Cd) transporter
LTDAHSLCDSIENNIKSIFSDAYTTIHIEPFEKA